MSYSTSIDEQLLDRERTRLDFFRAGDYVPPCKLQQQGSAILLVAGPDRPGLLPPMSGFLHRHHAHILHADQHHAGETGLFLMRMEWELANYMLDVAKFETHFAPIAEELQLSWRLELSTSRPKVAIFVSQYDHCLADLLYRHERKEFACDISVILSNHTDSQRLAAFYEIPFHYIPVTPDCKHAAERQQLALLDEHAIDLVVLARYMQILSADFVAHFPNRIINVHHSVLPAFSGARPYHQAFDRGVKLIGATSHYVTATLDDGPIIEQDVVRISHRDHVQDLIEKGRDLEQRVLARAVRAHIEHRIMVFGNKTVVFD